MKPFKSLGFELFIPDDWVRVLPLDIFTSDHFAEPPQKPSDSRTLVGPDGKFLNILITPLLKNEHEPTIAETAEYFDGLAYRQSLDILATGTICVMQKNHFWAWYCSPSVMAHAMGQGAGQLQFMKKYCLYLNRTEYLITARLQSAIPGQKLPTDEELVESEKLYDEIIRTFHTIP